MRVGLGRLDIVLGRKVMPMIREEFSRAGLTSESKMHPAEELLSSLDKIFGPSNGLFFLRFFLDFLKPTDS